MKAKVALGVVLCVPVLVGCNASVSSYIGSAKPTLPVLKIDGNVGFVEGRLISVGGPPGAPNSPDQGEVTFTNVATGAVWNIPTEPNGTFNAYITPGTYNAVGTTPQYVINDAEGTCSADKRVVVRLNQTVTTTVVCSRK